MGGGGQQQQPQQPLPAAQATQPDPGNQPNIAALMMQSHNRDVQSARLNYHLAGMAAAFRPHGQQNADPGAGGYDDSLPEYDKIQQIMSQQMKADNEKSLLASAELLGPSMGTKPGQATAAVRAGVFGQILQNHLPTASRRHLSVNIVALRRLLRSSFRQNIQTGGRSKSRRRSITVCRRKC